MSYVSREDSQVYHLCTCQISFLNSLNSPVKILSTYGSELKSFDSSTLIHFLSVLILKTLPEILGNLIYLQNLSENSHLSPREGTILIIEHISFGNYLS